MTVRLSRHEGKTWAHARRLHEGLAAYSSLAVLPDGGIGCLYERGETHAYETLTFSRFSLDWLTTEKRIEEEGTGDPSVRPHSGVPWLFAFRGLMALVRSEVIEPLGLTSTGLVSRGFARKRLVRATEPVLGR